MKKKTYHSLADAPAVYVPVEDVMKNYAAEAAISTRCWVRTSRPG